MYSVIASDGQTYGPVDVDTLKTWISEGRLTRDSNLVEAASGKTLRASDVPELVSLLGAPVMSAPQPGTAPGGPGMGYPRESTFAQAPASPYFRPGMGGTVNPAELKGFDWGAFYFTWIWGLNHKKPILLLALLGFIPYVGPLVALGIGIWAGINGYQWAWESERFSSVQDMKACQRIWGWWALGVFLFTILMYALFAAAFLAFFLHAGPNGTYSPTPLTPTH